MKLLQGDCLKLMKEIKDKSVDMILCDLPYGTTQNKWDSIIDLELLWKQYKRIIKDNGAIVLTAQDKFTAKLILSNEEIHKYNLVWDKVLTSGFLNANRMPLRVHENICIFYKKLPTYNPQKVIGEKNHSKGTMKTDVNNNYGKYGKIDNTEILGDMKHPKSIITFQKPHPSKCLHPTQKPLELFEWLIKTYTDEGDIVLDNCMGSGTTGVACKNLNRNFIGMELDDKYFKIAKERIDGVLHRKDVEVRK
jgi:site-specific DNA-methyltransferase (adenine-specific)